MTSESCDLVGGMHTHIIFITHKGTTLIFCWPRADVHIITILEYDLNTSNWRWHAPSYGMIDVYAHTHRHQQLHVANPKLTLGYAIGGTPSAKFGTSLTCASVAGSSSRSVSAKNSSKSVVEHRHDAMTQWRREEMVHTRATAHHSGQ